MKTKIFSKIHKFLVEKALLMLMLELILAYLTWGNFWLVIAIFISFPALYSVVFILSQNEREDDISTNNTPIK